ncbi:hypothetical protein [Flavobacterium pectinovorum]|uniref:Lipoprotein n=1 Tax=Flavobacterium pectinovorum TaxID=29533 RepID=A0A502EF16_9FLAO|nr:hypothetical protein [Flavobacterium pectinovorum]TPG36315.1 hypothetical protein EAH81_19780 [Flavobacterium pectinovorum]
MRNYYFLVITFLFLSCNKSKELKANFIDQTLDLIIENSNEESIEFPDLYANLTNKIDDDKDEKLKLVEKLKLKGFKIVNWGRGNNPPTGPRIVSVSLRKEECECEVTKIYYFTVSESEYKMTEKIKCKAIKP